MKTVRKIIVVLGVLLMVMSSWADWLPPVNLGSNVNSTAVDNSPCVNLTADTLYFSSARTGGIGISDIWMTVFLGGSWQTPTNMGAPINTIRMESDPAISANGQDLYFAALNWPGGSGLYDIWVSHKTGGVWGTPTNVTPLNSTANEISPFVSADGQKLFFTRSTTPSSNYDLFTSQWTGTQWGPPIPIAELNTTYEEKHPTMTADGQTLFFSSQRSGGFGAHDVYMAQWTGIQWSVPTNIGDVINTADNEQFPSISGDGMKLFFGADRAGGIGNFDIWVSYYQLTADIQGIISLSNNPPDLSNSIVQLTTVNGITFDTTDVLGAYAFSAIPQSAVTMLVLHSGYAPWDTTFNNVGAEINHTLILTPNPTSFSDHFESGFTNWFGYWGLTTESSHSPTHSLTDSPGINYSDSTDNWESIVQGVDLSDFNVGVVRYWTKYALETDSDVVFLGVTTDDGVNWTALLTYTGTQDQWTADSADIASYTGQANVKFGFRLVSNDSVNADGFYVDDFQVDSHFQDFVPPVIIHIPSPDTLSWITNRIIYADITDTSGIQSASMFRRYDGGTYTEVQPDSTVGNRYYFAIPNQEPGTWVDYYFHATDNAVPSNSTTSAVFGHIFGTIIYYDDNNPENFVEYSPGNKIAVRFSTPQSRILVSLLFHFHQDASNDVDTVDVYVWDNSGVLPSQVRLGPIAIYPANTTQNPDVWTRVDLRSYSFPTHTEFHSGCQIRSNRPVIWGDTPAVTGRSHVYTSSWGNTTCDLDIRAVLGQTTDTPENPSTVPLSFSLLPAYPNPFNSSCVVSFMLDRREHIQVSAFNILGRKVATLIDAVQDPGIHQLTWNAENLATGIYFIQLHSITDPSRSVPVRKVLLLK